MASSLLKTSSIKYKCNIFVLISFLVIFWQWWTTLYPGYFVPLGEGVGWVGHWLLKEKPHGEGKNNVPFSVLVSGSNLLSVVS